jgi:hypothetical protein
MGLESPAIAAAIAGDLKLWARCLVAWNQVCMPKEKGGLGMKDVAIQNQCLLLKLLHRLHHPANLAWARWARE